MEVPPLKLLLHACCCPCTLEPLRLLLEEGHDIAIAYMNSNIHPAEEYEHRRAVLLDFAREQGLEVIEGVYDPQAWSRAAGVFGSDKRWKAICGMALAVAIRCFGHVISGVIFYSQNAWDGWGAWGYSLAFNLSSRLPEGILSILIVSVLPLTLMRRAIARREANDGYC